MCGSTYVLGILMGLGAVLQKKLDNQDHALRPHTHAHTNAKTHAHTYAHAQIKHVHAHENARAKAHANAHIHTSHACALKH